MDKLTNKQQAFAQSVAKKEFDFIWEAYAANYNVKKMSQNAIYVEACRLLQNPKVALRIQEIENEIVKESQSTLDEVLIAMSKRVRLDTREYFESDGTFKNIHDLTKDQAMCISEFNVQEIWGGKGEERSVIGVIKKVKLIDLKSLWDMFMKKYGQFVTKHELTDNSLDHLADILKDIKE